MKNVITPYHWHNCPGVKSHPARKIAAHHKPHEYPCFNPRCTVGVKRYCGLIVDAMFVQCGATTRRLIKKYL